MAGVIEASAASYLDQTRTAYDIVAADYAELVRPAMDESTWDRAVLGAFAEVVRGPVADLGCGPGRVAGYLADLGVAVAGVDLSPRMVEVARAEYPKLSFTVGSILDLDLPDGELGGVVGWYSLVHTPPAVLPVAFAEFARVLRSGGHLLIAFKVGAEKRSLTSGYGHDIDLDVYWYPVQEIVDRLAAAGFAESMRLVRAAEPHEKQPQGYLLMVKG